MNYLSNCNLGYVTSDKTFVLKHSFLNHALYPYVQYLHTYTYVRTYVWDFDDVTKLAVQTN